MSELSQKARNLIGDYIESAGGDSSLLAYVADLEQALLDVTTYADMVGSKTDAVHIAVMKRAREVLPMESESSDKTLRVGALVKWTSQAAGRSKEKLGTIEAIIPAGKRPELKGCGYQRDHESYVVRVTERYPNGNVRSTKLYWPRVRHLVLA